MIGVHKILVVEDDDVIAMAIKSHLEIWGYNVECITDFKDVTSTFVKNDPQLVLMDISLPFYNGYYWCSEIRKLSKVPIIFISSANDSMNIVMAVNMGGDDFIAKPFDFNVLVAKVQALIRRTYDFAGKTNIMEHNGVMLNISDATLHYNGEKLELTKNDNKIMQILMENTGKAVSRDTIMTKLWETDSYIDDNTLTVNMARLRKKLEQIGIIDFIITKKGIGYMVN